MPVYKHCQANYQHRMCEGHRDRPLNVSGFYFVHVRGKLPHRFLFICIRNQRKSSFE